jgi:hypothetical protein
VARRPDYTIDGVADAGRGEREPARTLCQDRQLMPECPSSFVDFNQ